jgi:ribosomal-protein-alanine N-acetyltransferase
MRLARLEPRHARAMHDIERQCFSLPWSEEQCRAAFAQKAFAAFGLFLRERLVGYVSIYHTPGELEILNIAVLPELRRRGCGRRILRLVLRLARKMGMHKASLEVRVGNAAAIALYESCGFTRAGVRRKYYSDTGEDAVIYICSI